MFHFLWINCSLFSNFQQKIDYVRPIVILGPMKDRILEDLIQDQPQKFGVCIPRKSKIIEKENVTISLFFCVSYPNFLSDLVIQDKYF